MDGTLAIEANREALKRIVAMLVDMAGLAEPAPEADKLAEVTDNPLTASLRSAPLPLKGGEEGRAPSPPPSAFPYGAGEGAGVTPSLLPLKGGVEGAATSPPRSPLFVETGEKAGAPSPPRSPLPHRSGERWPAKRVGEGVEVTRAARRGDIPRPGHHPEMPTEGGPRRTLPRLLWRAILAVLRPAESAARRLIIATARGLVVPPPTPRPPKPQTMEPLLRRLGIAVIVTRADRAAILPRFTGGEQPVCRRQIHRASGTMEGRRTPGRCVSTGDPAGRDHAKRGGGGAVTLPLFDPPRHLGPRTRHVPAYAAPRIWWPGLTEPARLPPPPSPDDLISAEHLTRRLAALAKALDDLPGQARRFARLKAAREAQLARTVFPLRRSRPPGGRLFRYDPSTTHPPRIREVDEILAHAHALALCALECPDTS